MRERAGDMWNWLESLEGGAANFIGSFTGAVVGLVAIVIGALFNAHLNRQRDDRLKGADARAIAAALKAELEGIDKSLLYNADDLKDVKGNFTVPDLAHQVRIMPHLLSKLGLLNDSNTIEQIIGTYVVIDQYLEKLTMLGGKMVDLMPSHRRVVYVPGERAESVAKINRNLSVMIRGTIGKLDEHLG